MESDVLAIQGIIIRMRARAIRALGREMKEKTEEIDIEEGEEEEGEEGDKSASTGHSRGTRAEQLRQSEGQGQQRDEGTDGNDRPRFKGSRAEASKASQREKSSGPGTRVLSRGTGLWRSGRKSTVWPWDTSQGLEKPNVSCRLRAGCLVESSAGTE